MKLRLLLRALVPAALGGCAGVPAPPATELPLSLVGCYQIQWSADAARLGLPWGFELRGAALEEGWAIHSRGDARGALTATSPTGRMDHPFGYWISTRGDSIEVGYPAGGGTILTLSPEGHDLIGVGRSVGDALRPGEPTNSPVGLVIARSVTCGAA